MTTRKIPTRDELRQRAGYTFAEEIHNAGGHNRLANIEALATDTPDQNSFDRGIIKFCNTLRGSDHA